MICQQHEKSVSFSKCLFIEKYQEQIYMVGSKVLVLGGGFGGVQAAITARAALDPTHEVTIVDQHRVTHLCGMNPLLIVGEQDANKTGRSLGRLSNRGVKFMEAHVNSINTQDQKVITSVET
ncbi:uncharacterized protein METZ01_LOCUS470412, partial [marine metagenome]